MKRLFATEIMWLLLVIGLALLVANHFQHYWVYSYGMPGKCLQCGMNHSGQCPKLSP